MVLLQFINGKEIEYFLNSDHNDWLGLYQFRKINSTTIYFNDSILKLIDPKNKCGGLTDNDCANNKRFMFGRKVKTNPDEWIQLQIEWIQ
jgi:hypothetical protein